MTKRYIQIYDYSYSALAMIASECITLHQSYPFLPLGSYPGPDLAHGSLVLSYAAPKGTSIGSAVFAELMVVITDQHRNRQIEHVTSVAINRPHLRC